MAVLRADFDLMRVDSVSAGREGVQEGASCTGFGEVGGDVVGGCLDGKGVVFWACGRWWW